MRNNRRVLVVIIGNALLLTSIVSWSWSRGAAIGVVVMAFVPFPTTRNHHHLQVRRLLPTTETLSWNAKKNRDNRNTVDDDSSNSSEDAAWSDNDNAAANSDDRAKTLQSLGLDPRNNDALLEYSIDSFLRGDYDRPFADDAVAPLPGLTPGATVEQALQALRHLDDPEPSHGAACLLRFCVPLRRGERWSPPPTTRAAQPGAAAWKELLRGSLTPTMLARRLRASPDFSILLDWDRMDVTEGAVMGKDDFVLEDSVAFVNAAFYFGGERRNTTNINNKSTNGNIEAAAPPELLQIKLSRIGGVWLIDSVQHVPKSLFQDLAAPSEGD